MCWTVEGVLGHKRHRESVGVFGQQQQKIQDFVYRRPQESLVGKMAKNHS